ncbi:unnamed protein product, partial [Citrullus colocynthis]
LLYILNFRSRRLPCVPFATTSQQHFAQSSESRNQLSSVTGFQVATAARRATVQHLCSSSSATQRCFESDVFSSFAIAISCHSPLPPLKVARI